MSKRVLLIIDDEVGLAKLTKLNLELTGEFQVEVVYSGIEGVKKATEGVIDLVITDFRMPGMDGKAVARAIKEVKPKCPILLCTGDLEVFSEGSTEVDGVINKPVDHKNLYGIINAVIAKQA